MGKNNRSKTKTKKTILKKCLSGLKEQIHRYGKELLAKQRKK